MSDLLKSSRLPQSHDYGEHSTNHRARLMIPYQSHVTSCDGDMANHVRRLFLFIHFSAMFVSWVLIFQQLSFVDVVSQLCLFLQCWFSKSVYFVSVNFPMWIFRQCWFSQLCLFLVSFGFQTVFIFVPNRRRTVNVDVIVVSKCSLCGWVGEKGIFWARQGAEWGQKWVSWSWAWDQYRLKFASLYKGPTFQARF